MPSFPTGRLKHRVRLERRVRADDGYGNVEANWQILATRFCSIKGDTGGERQDGGRPQSTFRAKLKLRLDSVTRTITAADRAVLVSAPYAGMVAAIVSIMPTDDNAFVDIAIEQGAPT